MRLLAAANASHSANASVLTIWPDETKVEMFGHNGTNMLGDIQTKHVGTKLSNQFPATVLEVLLPENLDRL